MSESPRISTSTNLYASLRAHAQSAVTGRVLCIDPSVGSFSSQPGYAVLEAGVQVDSGVVDMPVEATRSRRLFYLRRILTEQFAEHYDLVVVEDIPVMRFSKGRGGRSYGNAKAQVPLHKAVGVIESCFDAPVVFVSPHTWRTHATPEHLHAKEVGESTDELDASAMGRAVVATARHILDAATKPTRKKRSK